MGTGGVFDSPLATGTVQVVLAFIVIVLAGVVAYQNRQISRLYEDRLRDAKEMNDKVTMPLTSISQTINLIYDKLRDGKRERET